MVSVAQSAPLGALDESGSLVICSVTLKRSGEPTPVEQGAGATYVKPAAVMVPVSELVTTTFCAPAVPAGVVAVIVVEFTMTTFVAATPPTFTVALLLKSVPVIVMAVPPAVEPEAGEMLVIVGAERVVKLSTAPGDHVVPLVPSTAVHAA